MNLYIIKIEEKYFKNLLRYHIKIVKIRKKDNYYYLYLDYSNYQKISKLKKIYNFTPPETTFWHIFMGKMHVITHYPDTDAHAYALASEMSARFTPPPQAVREHDF